MEKIQDDFIVNAERIGQDAKSWYIKIHYGGNDPSQQKKFEIWLAAHKDHQKCYDDVCIFMQETEKHTSDPLSKERYKHLLDVEANSRVSLKENIIGFLQRGRISDASQRKTLWGSIAVSLFLLLSLSFIVQIFIRDDSYQTAVGEQKTVTLADGSTVKLNTNTKITVAFTDLNRSVILDQGQAYFIISKDPEHPFVVTFDGGSVTALGTEFEVYNKGPEVIVSLVEGKVKVQSYPKNTTAKQIRGVEPEEIIMSTKDDLGTQISLSPNHISPIIKTDNDLINAWQKERLIFRKASLDHIIAEINRYSPRKIILAEPSLGNEVVSGVFPIDSGEAIDIISQYLGLTKSINDNDEIILSQINQ